MAFYSKKFDRAMNSKSARPADFAEIFEGIFRLELVETTATQIRDPDGRFVGKSDTAEMLGVELSDELPPRDFADGDYLPIEELGATGDDAEYDEEGEAIEEENEDAAWCNANRALCVPYRGMTGVPRRPNKGYSPAPTAKTFMVRKTGKWGVELRAV